MNPEWTRFLTSQGAAEHPDGGFNFPESDHNLSDKIYPVSHLTSFEVSGADAATFLQGQLTCNINDLSDTNASLAAFCNAKGRVISTLLIIKQADRFIIVLPHSLLKKVIHRLSMYILRSKVQIVDQSDTLCLIGIQSGITTLNDRKMPGKPFDAIIADVSMIRLPGGVNRFLLVGTCDPVISLWNQVCKGKILRPSDSMEWALLDLYSGIPWFDEAQSEHYIPQMINIDSLNGISLTKGCYTGQEIIARTHYLGKAKREMFLAECSKTAMLNDDTDIINSANHESCGKILSCLRNNERCGLLVVMQKNDFEPENLTLNNTARDKLHIIPFQ